LHEEGIRRKETLANASRWAQSVTGSDLMRRWRSSETRLHGFIAHQHLGGNDDGEALEGGMEPALCRGGRHLA